MIFQHLLKRLLHVSKYYKNYIKTDKEKKYIELLRKISKRLMLHVNLAVQEDLSVIQKYTKSNLIYWSEFGPQLSSLLLQKNICFDPEDADSLLQFSRFLEVYGWMGESEQINLFLEEKKIKKAAIFAISLELYKYGRQHEMVDEEISKMLIKLNLL